MSAEIHPQRRFSDGRPVAENQETTVPALLAQAVEDLAVYEPVQAAVVELLGTEDPQVVEAYFLSWKQALRQNFEATALSAIDTFVAGFWQFKAEPEMGGQGDFDLAKDNAGSESPISP